MKSNQFSSLYEKRMNYLIIPLFSAFQLMWLVRYRLVHAHTKKAMAKQQTPGDAACCRVYVLLAELRCSVHQTHFPHRTESW